MLDTLQATGISTWRWISIKETWWTAVSVEMKGSDVASEENNSNSLANSCNNSYTEKSDTQISIHSEDMQGGICFFPLPTSSLPLFFGIPPLDGDSRSEKICVN